jgi:hypothetical protein
MIAPVVLADERRVAHTAAELIVHVCMVLGRDPPGRTGTRDGAITSHATPRLSSSRLIVQPVGPAS